MSKSVVKLLGTWVSPYSHKVQIALNLKSINYEFVEEDLINKSQRLLEANPVHKKIPVLVHDGKSICESLAIVQYIDELWTASGRRTILPSDPYERATARFWAAYIDDKLFACIWAAFLGVLADGEDGEKAEIPLEEAHQLMAVLENALLDCGKGESRFFGGDEVGYVDIVLGSYLGWIKMTEKLGNLSLIDESITPHLFEWAHNVCDVDAVKDVLPDVDKLAEFGKSYAARLKNSCN